MDNFAQAYVQFGDHEINYQRRFPQWDGLFSRFPVIKSHYLKRNMKLN